MITAATLMTLTSLSGLLTMTFLMRINFKVEDRKEFLMTKLQDDEFKSPVQVRLKGMSTLLVDPWILIPLTNIFNKGHLIKNFTLFQKGNYGL